VGISYLYRLLYASNLIESFDYIGHEIDRRGRASISMIYKLFVCFVTSLR
jgi:hypothetical protein